ncbi:MAG: pentapeptide repeat-containing protein, partial [Cyanobacteria bacterium P01_E01_bin.43]
MDRKELQERYNAGQRDFAGLRLVESDLLQLRLNHINFSRSDLRQSRLGRTHFRQANFEHSDLS